MLTVDSSASESRATEPETKQATSFIEKITSPPIIAVRATPLFSIRKKNLHRTLRCYPSTYPQNTIMRARAFLKSQNLIPCMVMHYVGNGFISFFWYTPFASFTVYTLLMLFFYIGFFPTILSLLWVKYASENLEFYRSSAPTCALAHFARTH